MPAAQSANAPLVLHAGSSAVIDAYPGQSGYDFVIANVVNGYDVPTCISVQSQSAIPNGVSLTVMASATAPVSCGVLGLAMFVSASDHSDVVATVMYMQAVP